VWFDLEFPDEKHNCTDCKLNCKNCLIVKIICINCKRYDKCKFKGYPKTTIGNLRILELYNFCSVHNALLRDGGIEKQSYKKMRLFNIIKNTIEGWKIEKGKADLNKLKGRAHGKHRSI